MGTRALVRFMDEDDLVVVCLYRHFDGDEELIEVAKFLRDANDLEAYVSFRNKEIKINHFAMAYIQSRDFDSYLLLAPAEMEEPEQDGDIEFSIDIKLGTIEVASRNIKKWFSGSWQDFIEWFDD